MLSWYPKEMADKGLGPWSPPTKAEASGTREKKALFSSRCKHERLCHSMWLFHIHRMVNIQIFYPLFLLSESIANVFFCYSFGISRKKASILSMLQPFLTTYQQVHGLWTLLRAHNTDTIYLLSSFFGCVVIFIHNYLKLFIIIFFVAWK